MGSIEGATVTRSSESAAPAPQPAYAGPCIGAARGGCEAVRVATCQPALSLRLCRVAVECAALVKGLASKAISALHGQVLQVQARS
eukprot:CAMPEP_0206238944 /NCGR_PEP_ID=MMETSP0047_2-20121206/15100_1 /ASSEMBLY_ACC=CAM_ASM_000192 /TAXON_ID=195065 /ORGANISM="Chroomonas mesostigmatica_cf, Strain CCMP1168" /LENGTH=85 /DNA_ID=CAMNT_0053663543 /DNA_START=148 /DNA_END=406 /DNA_ORIENTATION=+